MSQLALQARPGFGRDQDYPLFMENRAGHGRVEERAVHAFAIEPMEAGFAHARSLIVVGSQRTVKKRGQQQRILLLPVQRSARPNTVQTNGSN